MSSHAKAPIRIIAVAVVAALVPLIFSVSSAFAVVPSHHLKETFGSAQQPEFTGPAGIAVDPANGDLYVIDFPEKTLNRFKPNGEPDPFSALPGSNVIDGKEGADTVPGVEQILSNEGSAVEVQVAIAPPGSAADTAGDIYVTNGENGQVDVFAPSGEYLGHISSSFPCGVSVGPEGDVYVGDYFDGVYKLTPTATPGVFTNAPGSPFAATEACNVAAGFGPSAGSVFVSSFGGKVTKLGDESYVAATSSKGGISIDPGTGHLYVADTASGPVQELDVSGATPEEVSSTAVFANGIAVDGASGNLYVSPAGADKLQVFGPLASTGTVTVTVNVTGSGKVSQTASSIGSTPPASGAISNCTSAGGANCSAVFLEGEEPEFEATPDPNNHLVAWTAVEHAAGTTCSGTTSPCTIELGSEDVNAAVEFGQAGFNLSVNVTGTASISAAPGPIENCEAGPAGTCSGSYSGGEAVTLTATGLPAHFRIAWSGITCDVETETECQLAMPGADTVVNAASVRITHKIAVVPTTAHGAVSALEPPVPTSGHIAGCEEGSGECEATYGAGQTVALKATPAVGFESHWATPGACLNPNPDAAAECQLEVTDGADVTAEVSFSPLPGQAIFTTATNGGNGGGTLLCDSGSGFEACHATYAEDTTVTLKATPNGHSVFSSLNVTGSSSTTCSGALSECTVEVQASEVVATAAFAAIRLTKVEPNAGPTSGGTGVILEGENLGTVTGVSFGGTPAASFNQLGTNKVEAVTPAHAAGAVEVVTESALGSSQGGSSTFTYSVAPPTVTGVSPSEGPTAGGQVVTIAGTGLTGASAVKFGSNTVACPQASSPGKCVVLNGGEIEVQTPGRTAGTVDVTVIAPSGTSATSAADHYTYLAKPTVTSVSPSEGPTAGGTTVIVKGANLTGASFEFGQSAATSVEILAAGEARMKAPAGSVGTVEVIAATGGGTSSATTADRYTYVVPTHALTVATTGTGSGSVSCNGGGCAASYQQGTKVTLTASPAAGSSFSGWSGAGCSGTGTCTVTIEADTTVTAGFSASSSGGGGGGGGEAVMCVVPKLKGLSLGKAKSALAAAHCSTGKVTKPKPKRGAKAGPLVVKSSSPGAGATAPKGAKVALKLGPKPKKTKKNKRAGRHHR